MHGVNERGPVQGALLTLYVIFLNPLDYPGKYVVRRQAVTAEGAAIEVAPLAIVNSLADARAALPPMLFNMGRTADDDPPIVEVWI